MTAVKSVPQVALDVVLKQLFLNKDVAFPLGENQFEKGFQQKFEFFPAGPIIFFNHLCGFTKNSHSLVAQYYRKPLRSNCRK